MNKLKLLFTATILTIFAFSLSSCNNDDYTSEGGEITTSEISETVTLEEVPATDIIEEKVPLTVVDRNGETITIPDEINSIVSASPATTEILVGLGLADKIVAADFYSADVEGIDPAICTIDFYSLSVETLLSLNPDVIIINGISVVGDDNPYKELVDAGVSTVYIPDANSIHSIRDDIEFLAAYTRTVAMGEKLIGDINSAVTEISKRTINLPKKSVYFEIGAAPYLYTAGSGTFINDIINICGGENIYAGEKGWLSNSNESVVAGNPEIILTNVMYDGYDYNEIYSRAGWENIPAIVKENVYQISPNASSRASQNIVEAIEEIATKIYPGIYFDAEE